MRLRLLLSLFDVLSLVFFIACIYYRSSIELIIFLVTTVSISIIGNRALTAKEAQNDKSGW